MYFFPWNGKKRQTFLPHWCQNQFFQPARHVPFPFFFSFSSYAHLWPERCALRAIRRAKYFIAQYITRQRGLGSPPRRAFFFSLSHSYTISVWFGLFLTSSWAARIVVVVAGSAARWSSSWPVFNERSTGLGAKPLFPSRQPLYPSRV